MCISVLDNDYIRNTFCMGAGGGDDKKRKTLLLHYWTLSARREKTIISCSRGEQVRLLPDIHYNAEREINFAK